MARKEFDWIGINLSNPGFSNTDFKDSGVNIGNTSIASEDVYLNNPLIRNDELFQTNGKFDPYKFHEKYVALAESYNNLALDTFDEDLKQLGRVFGEDNIFVSPEERMKGTTTYMTLIDNPDHVSYGIVGIDKVGPRTKSAMELAETLPIFDSRTGKFTEESPEESFFKNFWRPMMLATYDEDVDINGNPTSDPSQIAHYKGERKLNEDGEYYFEFVNGRSTYGKELLSKWNIITKEDSILNKYDPFDSDDIHKSWQGSVMRNAIKILPLLTPVAPYYAAASITINLVDALGTLGKLVLGSKNETLNNITAFSESFNLTVSEEGMLKTFGAENVINMVGDTFMFLKSQNILAKYAPRLFMEKVPTTPEEQSRAVLKIADDYLAAQEKAIREKLASIPGALDPAKATMLLQAEIQTAQKAALPMAQSMVNAEIENFHKLGKLISTSMMAVTFGLHTYGEAKALNVSDTAATALTLGAIAGLYALLSSHIGLKIFPEATVLKLQIKKALLELMQPSDIEGNLAKTTEALAKETTKAAKIGRTLSLMLKGKQLADKVWGVNGSVIGTVAASTIATSIEMTSFTALDDVIASVYNLGAWISGDANRMSAWENVGGRYGSSLLGGAIAGAIAAPDIYQAAKNIRNMQSPLALEIIAHLINEGKAQEVRNIINKNTWANPYLSTRAIAERELSSGERKEIYGTGTPSDNQNEEAKQRMLEVIDGMEKILTTYGAKIDSNSLLNVLVNGKNITHDIRYALLKDSNIAQMYLKEFVKNQVDIYTYAKLISLDEKDKAATGRTDAKTRAIKEEEKELEKKKKEEQPKAKEGESQQPVEENEDTDAVSEDTKNDLNAKDKLKEALKLNAKYMSGQMAEEFIGQALFEMLPGINKPYWDAAFREYVEHNSVKKSYEKATLLEKLELLERFEAERTGEAGVYNLRMAYNLYIKSIQASKDILKEIHTKDNTPEILSLKDIVEDVKLFMRRELFWSHSNPYSSPYELNTLEAPEATIRKSFILNAEDKIWQDRQTTIINLKKKYKSLNPEIDKALERLLLLHTAIIEYRKFVSETKNLSDASKAKFEEYKARKDKAIAAGQEFTEEPPEVMEFNRETILNELTKARATRLALGPGHEASFTEIISDMLERIQQRLLSDVFNEALKKELQGLYWSLVEPEAFYDKTYDGPSVQTINGFRTLPNTARTLENLIEGMLLKVAGVPFIEEIYKATLNKAGYIDLETKNILISVLDILETTAKKKGAVYGLLDPNIKTASNDHPNFNLLTALELMDSTYTDVTKAVQEIDLEEQEGKTILKELAIHADEAKKSLNGYNTNGLLKIANTLMTNMGMAKNRKEPITEILLALEAQITSQTERNYSILNPSKTNIKEFILSPTMIMDMNDAILILQMIRSAYVSADGEVRDSLNSIGFNPTWNKIHNLTGDDALPVLDPTHVVEEVLDIQDIIYKLLYWKEVASNAMKMRTELTDLVDLGLDVNRFTQITSKILGLRTSKEVKSEWKGLDEFENEVNKLTHLTTMRDAKTLERITNQSDDTKEAILKEYIQFEIALHKFLRTNDDLVKNPKTLAELINPTHFSIDKGNQFSSLSLEDKLDDDIALIWYIASIGALDPNVYYSNLREAFSGTKLPVGIQNMWKYQATAFVLFQDYIDNFANAMAESYRKKYPNLESSDLELKKEAQLELFKDFIGTDINPHRRNIFLVESGAGSGKTDGYLPELVALLLKLDPKLDLDKDLWIAGPEDMFGREKPTDPIGSRKDMPAIKIRQAIKSKTAKTFTRDTLMKHILANFEEYENKYKVINGKLQSTSTNQELHVFDVDITTGKIKFDYKLNEGLAELPKLIILDEISDYSTLDLDVIQDFAKLHNIRVLASGDFTLSGIYGQVKIKVGNENLDSILRAGSCEFIRTLKSQLSFRTTNTLSDNNNDKIRVYFEKLLNYTRSKGQLKDPTMPNVLNLSYHFDPTTGNLHGTYVSTNSEGVLTETLKKYIDGIYQSIQNDPEKTVTLLYSDDNSQILKYIKEHTGSYDWTTKTSFRQGTVLKGVESTYYIIDLNPDIPDGGLAVSGDVEHFWNERERVVREIYTALTRLKLGAILIPRYNGKIDTFGIDSPKADKDSKEISMSPDFIEKRVKKRIEILGTMFPKVLNVEVAIPDPIVSPSEGPPVTPLGEEEIPEGFGSEKNYKVIEGEEFEYEDVKTERKYVAERAAEEDKNESPIVYKKADRKIEYISTFEAEDAATQQDAELMTSISDEGCTGLLHTFATYRTGFATDARGTVSLDIKKRRDCAHGFYYCMQKTNQVVEGLLGQYQNPNNITASEVEKTENVLTRLATIAKTKDNADVLKDFIRILGLSGEKGIYMRYAFTGALPYDTDGLARADLLNVDYEREKGFGGKGIGAENNKISRKELYLIIGLNHNDQKDILFMLPIGILPHYRTMIHNSPALWTSNIGTELAKGEAYLRTIKDKKLRGKASVALDKKMYQMLKADANSANPTEGSAFMVKLIEIWRNTTQFALFLDGSFLLATTKNHKGFLNLGPFLLTAKRGQDYSFEGYELDLTDSSRANMYKVHNLSDLREDMDVSRIYTALSEQGHRYTITSGFTIKSGGYYVLVAPKGEFRELSTGILKENEMFRYYLQLLNDPEHTPIKVKLLNVRPPKADVGDYMDNEFKSLFKSPDKKTRERLNIGNQFTSYRVLQTIFADYDENGDSDLNNAVKSLLGLTQGDHVNVSDVRTNVLRLTYLEGLKDKEKLTTLGKIYKIAEVELDADLKQELEQRIIDDNGVHDYIGLLSALMRDLSVVRYSIRNSFRYFLAYLWHADTLNLPSIGGHENIRNFLTEQFSKYSLLYNPAYRGASQGPPEFIIDMRYEGSSQTERLSFYRTETDNITGKNNGERYEYEGKPFEYAAEIIHGPLYGDLTYLVNTVLQGFDSVVEQKFRDGTRRFVPRSGDLYYLSKLKDAIDYSEINPLLYFNLGKRDLIDEYVRTKGILALDGRNSPYLSIKWGKGLSMLRFIIEKSELGLNPAEIQEARGMTFTETERLGLIKNARSLNTSTHRVIEVTTDTDKHYFLISKGRSGGYSIQKLSDSSQPPARPVTPTPPTGGTRPAFPTSLPWDPNVYPTVEKDSVMGYKMYERSSSENGLEITEQFIPELKRVFHYITTGGNGPRISYVETTYSDQRTLTIMDRGNVIKKLSGAEAEAEYERIISARDEEMFKERVRELAAARNEERERERNLTAFNRDALKNSTDEKEKTLYALTEELDFTNPDFSVKDIINADIEGGDIIDMLKSVLKKRISDLPDKFIEEFNSMAEEKLIKELLLNDEQEIENPFRDLLGIEDSCDNIPF